MGDSLLSPHDGDIQFDCPHGDTGQTKSLYSHSTILRSRCEYYAQSNSPSIVLLNLPVFASAFLEGDSTIASISTLESENPRVSLGQDGTALHRRIITMTDDFDVVHNVVHYIYTNRITFSTVASET
jgi:hypothetical protein